MLPLFSCIAESKLKGASSDDKKNNRTGYLAKRNQGSAASNYPGMWSSDGQYLSQNVADVLIRALADVNHRRPKDPIGHLAAALYTLHYIPQEFTTNSSGSVSTNAVQDADNPGSGGSTDSTLARRAVFDNEKLPKEDNGIKNIKSTLITRHRTDIGESILHFAASHPHQEGAMFRLLGHTKEVTLAEKDKFYMTPRDMATDSSLFKNIAEIDSWVLKYVAEGKIDEVKQLVLDGYEHLLEIEDSEGNTAFDVARNKNQSRMFEVLKWASALEERREFLHKSIKVGSLPHVEFMADSEEMVLAKNSESQTSLHLAILCEEIAIVAMLTEKYPSLLAVGDNLGRTPLHYAMAVKDVDEVAKILVQNGATRNVKDYKGKLPSYYFMHREDIITMIKKIYDEDYNDAQQ